MAAGMEMAGWPHILMVPFPQEGHVNGALRLALNMLHAASQAALPLTLTFAYPARFYHLALKRATLPPSTDDVRSGLHLRPVEDGLPREEDHALTFAMFAASIPVFQRNVKLLTDQLLQVGAGSHGQLPSVCCIVCDSFVPWVHDVAHSACLPRVEFWTSTAATYSMGSQLSTLISQGVLPLDKNCWVDLETKWTVNAPLIEGVPGLPPFPPTDLPKEFVEAEKVTDFKLHFMIEAFSHVRDAYTILVNSLYDMEKPVFDGLRAIGLPIHGVGPLAENPQAPIPSSDVAMPKCISWLDMQAPCSVLYIALGSVAKFQQAEMHALALALEACERPFLWVIRTDTLEAGAVVEDALPTGFFQRTVDKGVGLIISWAPQTQVLAHPSVAAFFSHCGWNSTLESIWEGVPLLAYPCGAEQRSNAKWVVDVWKIGVGVERQVDGGFTQEAVEKAIEQLLSGDGALGYKERAVHAKDMARRALQVGGSSYESIVGFLKSLHASNQAT